VIPPAWTDVWICKHALGHLQATGRDARGRKQYRYHARWRAHRDDAKYGRMLSFGKALPAIRRAVEEALRRPGLPREKVLATVVHLLEATLMRIGNEEYARENKSRPDHPARPSCASGWQQRVVFRFRGKSGVQHAVEVHDRAGAINRMRDLPGQSCSSTRTTTAIRTPSIRPKSTTTCKPSPAPTTPPRTSALGRHRAGGRGLAGI
jgi:DNA topoisomerase-1